MPHSLLAVYPGAALEIVDGRVSAASPDLERRLGRRVVGEEFLALLDPGSRAKWRAFLAHGPAIPADSATRAHPLELVLLAARGEAPVVSFVVAHRPADAHDPADCLWLLEQHRDPRLESLVSQLSEAHSELAVIHRELERERGRLAEALARAEAAVRTRDDVLAVVAHDLRNPLAGISMTADLLLLKELPPERRRMRIEGIRDAALRVQRLVRDLLEVALLEAGHLRVDAERLDAGALLRETADAFEVQAQERGIDIAIDLPEGEPAPLAVLADRARFQSAIGNLLGNALRHSPAGSRVTLRARAQGDEVRFDVADSGEGIAAAEMPRLFERFWQSRREGGGAAGLGLAIARGVVEAHGGRIWAESTPGAGSTFSFTLRRSP